MTLKMLDPEDSYLWIYRKMIAGWVVIVGDPDSISRLEYAIYPPGTQKNADFEAVLRPVYPFYLGKKTPELCKLMQLENEKQSWDSMVLVVVSRTASGLTVFDSRHLKVGLDKERELETFVKKLVFWEAP